MPNVKLNANVGGGAFNGQMGGGGGAGLFDGDIIPLQRIPPQYPRDAARNGITGWVQLEVTVNPDGTRARLQGDGLEAAKASSKRRPSRR